MQALGAIDYKFYHKYNITQLHFSADNIKLTYVGNDTTVTTTPVNLIRKGIAWDSDKRYKFKNPTVPEGQTLEEGK